MADIHPLRGMRPGMGGAGDRLSGAAPVSAEPFFRNCPECLRAIAAGRALRHDMDEGVYIYEEDAGESGRFLGLICRVRLEDPENDVILLPEGDIAPDEACLRALREAGLQAGTVLGFYTDGGRITAKRLENLKNTVKPRYDISDGKTAFRLWVVNDPAAIEALREDFTDRKLRIARGAELYRAALSFRDELRGRDSSLPGGEFIMMILSEDSGGAAEGFLLPAGPVINDLNV